MVIDLSLLVKGRAWMWSGATNLET